MFALLLLAFLSVTPSCSLVVPLPTTFRAGSLVHTQTAPPVRSTTSIQTTAASGGMSPQSTINPPQQPLPRELLPITMGVFAQMLGEGIALSSLPLYLTKLGATPVTVGLAISCFSVAQMTFAPILVGLSSRNTIGRSVVLRICLAGAAASSLLIAFSGSIAGVLVGRTLAGVFAACVPVAQSGVTDILTPDQTAIGLSRVSAASQLGVVVGPAASAVFQEVFAGLGLARHLCLPAVFSVSSAFALGVLALMTVIDRGSVRSRSRNTVDHPKTEEHPNPDETAAATATATTTVTVVRAAQPMLRTITIIMGWTAILSNSIYGLFAPRFLNFAQPQLSATYSAAAAVMVATQIVFPRIVRAMESSSFGGTGVHGTCTLGILLAGFGIGAQSLIRVSPLHSILYMVNRAGAAIADTSTATLVASSSGGKESRSRNLALLTSTRAAARIFTPLLSSKLFEMSCVPGAVGLAGRVPGALPFVTASCFALAVAPFPMLLRNAERKKKVEKIS